MAELRIAGSLPPAVPPFDGTPGAEGRALWGRLVAALLAAALVMPLIGLGALPLLDPDEPYYAIPAREMLAGGHWWLTTFGGRPWLDKPPLFYWTVASSFAVLGESERAARLPSALAAIATVLLLPLIAARLGMRRIAGLAAALILATCVSTLVVGRLAITDSLLTLWETTALLAVVLLHRDPRPRWGAVWGLAGGLALLTKGPIGIVPILIGSLALLVVGVPRGPTPRWLTALSAAGTLLAVGLPWYAVIGWRHPRLLLDGFLLQGNLGRLLEPEHPRPAWYYVPVLFGLLLPWSALLPGGVLHAVERLRHRERIGGPPAPSIVLPLAWAFAVLLPVGIAATRLPTYVVPALPALALLMGGYLADARGGAAPRSWARTTAISGLGLGVVALAGAGMLFGHPKWAASTPGFAAVALIVALACWMIVFAPRTRNGVLAVLASGTLASALILAIALDVIAPGIAPLQSTRGLVLRAQRVGRAPDIAGLYAIPEDYSLDFYLRRPLPRLFDLDDLAGRVRRSPGRLWLIPRHVLADVRDAGLLEARPFACHPRVCLAELSPRSDSGGGPPSGALREGP